MRGYKKIVVGTKTKQQKTDNNSGKDFKVLSLKSNGKEPGSARIHQKYLYGYYFPKLLTLTMIVYGIQQMKQMTDRAMRMRTLACSHLQNMKASHWQEVPLHKPYGVNSFPSITEECHRTKKSGKKSCKFLPKNLFNDTKNSSVKSYSNTLFIS